MPSLRDELDAATTYKHLLHRSGLLREPVVGRCDFVHRTFMEYLAAKEALRQGHVGLLLENARLDQWREIVVLGAGLARPMEREELVGGLLARGDEDLENRHRYHLLAVACLETARELSAETEDRLKETLQTLVPPNNMTDAKALASAGALAIPLLPPFAGALVGQAAACVRTLALIGTPAALEALKAFAPDGRVTVSRELIRAWGYFDPEDYARVILSVSPLDRGAIAINDVSLLPYARHLTQAQSISIRARKAVDILDIANVSELVTDLDVSESKLGDLYPLRDCVNLRSLNLAFTPVAHLEPLKDLSALTVLKISNTLVQDLSVLSSLPLTSLDAMNTPVRDIGPLSAIETLRSLDIDHTQVEDSSPLADLPRLSWLDVSRTPLEVLIAGSTLRQLYGIASALRSLEGVPLSPALEVLNLSGSEELENLGLLNQAPRLRSLFLAGCKRLQTRELEPMSSVSSLTNVSIASTDIEHIGWLAPHSKLRSVALDECVQVSDLLPLADHNFLADLSLVGTGVTDFGPLLSLPALRRVTVSEDDFERANEVLKLHPNPNLRLFAAALLPGGYRRLFIP